MQTTLVKSKATLLTKFSLRLLGWLFLLLPTLALTAALPTVSRVKDINTTPSSGDPQNIVKVGNIIFFTAKTPTTGRELWKSDGTAAGTVMVKDIYAGSGSPFCDYYGCGNPNFTAVGNVLYFQANNGANGEELWKSDGTAAGTVMVKDINAGNGSSYPNYLTAVGNVLYFRAVNGVNGLELWKSNGTAAGTVLVKDIYPGNNSSLDEYSDLTAMGNVLYFAANNGVNGQELWKSNGTAAGTVMVKDIKAGSGDSYPYSLTAVGNVLYFVADNVVNGDELWRSDGTAAGTLMVKDIYDGNRGSYPDYLTAVGTVLYFHANNGVNSRELWKSDGTAAGTVMVKDIYAGSGDSYPYYLTAVGTVLYFFANNGVNGHELWRSDGTAAGTVLVKDINVGSGDSYPEYLTAVGNVLYFFANNGVNGRELWRSDGTAAGTVLVKDINVGSGDSYPEYLTAVGNVLYFVANNGVNGAELWKSDGTAAGTVLVKDIYAGSGDSYPDYLTVVGNVLYFVANNDLHGSELWKSDGTAAGTVLVKDIYPGSYGSYTSNTSNLTAVGNVLYFAADNGVTGYELWKSNGTAAGTVLVKDINAGSGDSYPDYLTAVGNVLYFVANNDLHGSELWKSDGTAAGTVMVKDIYAGSNNSNPDSLTAVGNLLYFVANNDLHGSELWKSDGTAAGTVLVKDTYPGNYGYVGNLTAVGNVLYFRAYDGVNGWELWKSDGTATGTVLVKDINPGAGSAWNYVDPNFTAVGNVLYFQANNGVNGYELWKSNGTAAGTAMVKDINPGSGSAWDYNSDRIFTVVGNMVYFSANNGVNGYELWRSDGTAAGTVMVKDIYAGSGSAWNYYDYPNFTTVGNLLYFQANNGVNGTELWQTDGTATGTQMKELVPGSDGSDSYGFTAIGTKLYFSAVDNATGRELWKADIPNMFTVTPSANSGGFITPNIPKAVAPNGKLQFTVTPLPNYTRNPTVGGTCPKGSWSGNVWTTGAITANCTVVFGFIGTLPDFVVTSITLNPVAPVANGTFSATMIVKNQGGTAGDGKFLDVWSHQPVNQTCGADGNQWQAVGSLAAGASKTFTFTGLAARTAGSKTFRAFVDSACGTAESNEGNNQMTKAYTVQ